MLFVCLWFQKRLSRMYLHVYAYIHINAALIKGDCQFENKEKQTWQELAVENLGEARRKGI